MFKFFANSEKTCLLSAAVESTHNNNAEAKARPKSSFCGKILKSFRKIKSLFKSKQSATSIACNNAVISVLSDEEKVVILNSAFNDMVLPFSDLLEARLAVVLFSALDDMAKSFESDYQFKPKPLYPVYEPPAIHPFLEYVLSGKRPCDVYDEKMPYSYHLERRSPCVGIMCYVLDNMRQARLSLLNSANVH